MIVDSVDAIYNYVLSYPRNAASILKENGKAFKEFIAQRIEKEGTVFIHKSVGIFICRV